MVFDPPRTQVKITRMMIYSLIPILSIYAAWRIQKFWMLVLIDFALGLAIGVPLTALFGALYGQPLYGDIPAFAIEIPIGLLIVRRFAREYNAKIAASNPPPQPSP